MSLKRIGSAVSLLLLSLSTTAAFAADAKSVPAAPIAENHSQSTLAALELDAHLVGAR